MITGHFLYEEECKSIISACFEVHNQLGYGFLESVYQEALCYEFLSRKVPFQKAKKLDIYYKDLKLEKFYIADFICFDNIIIETKAMDGIVDEHVSQVLNYLKATKLQLGLIINFGTPKVQVKRVIL
jgi:GxxExxY protein